MNTLCGIRLSTVGMVVGWLNLVGSLLSTILLCVAFTRLDDIIQAFMDNIGDKPNVDEESIRMVIVVAMCIYLTTSVANVIASALLIVGTVKERHLLLTPWLLNAYIVIVVNLFNFLYMIYVWIAKALPLESFILTALVTAIGLAVQMIIWSAIYSLFKQIRANRDQQTRLLSFMNEAAGNGNGGGPEYPNYTKMSYVVQ